MAFLQNVKNLVMQSSELTPEERTMYSKQLEYISAKTNEIEDLSKTTYFINTQFDSIERQLKALETNIQDGATVYTQINSSIDRLNSILRGYDVVVESTNNTWEKLEKVESLIHEVESKKAEYEKKVNKESQENSNKNTKSEEDNVAINA